MSNKKIKPGSVTKIVENGNTYYVINSRGDIYYYKDKKFQIKHRIDGPAIEYGNGDRSWYKDGELHREGGPAMDWASCKRYYLNGIEYTEKEYWRMIKFGSFV